jgi:hypothetical protein
VKVAIGVLSCNRFSLWRRTVKSLDLSEGAFELLLYDCSTDDRMQAYIANRGGRLAGNRKTTIGHGFRVLAEMALAKKPDIIVLSGDDYEYQPDWLSKRVTFWQAAPADVGICTLNIEPEYHWSKTIATHIIGGEVVQQRRTVPGANWSFRASLWSEIEPMIPDNSHKYDHAVCAYLRDSGRWLAALDLAVHIGEGLRSWK